MKKSKLIDPSGVRLTPGNFGKDCLGNGKHLTKRGKRIECCCDECDYLLCCADESYSQKCAACAEKNCPRLKLSEKELEDILTAYAQTEAGKFGSDEDMFSELRENFKNQK